METAFIMFRMMRNWNTIDNWSENKKVSSSVLCVVRAYKSDDVPTEKLIIFRLLRFFSLNDVLK